MEQVTIIGTGCAGWTAALYAARADLKPLIISGKMPGGLLTSTSIVENYPGFPDGIDGFELMEKMKAQAEKFGAQFKRGIVEKADLKSKPFKLTVDDGTVVESKTVIIATGCGHSHLGIESEKLLENKGVTYCAMCDGALPMFRSKPLIVVGGGDSAMEEALHLTRFASTVYIVHRRDELRASKIMADRAIKHEKIKMVWDTVVEEILDVKQGKVTGVKLKNLKTGKVSTQEAAGVFIAVGLLPNTKIFKGQIDLVETGHIKLTKGTRTNIEGVFAAGDVADHEYRQAITAAGTGCAAAIEAERYLAELAHKK